MPRIFPVIIKRVAATSAGFIASVVTAGVSFLNRFELLGGTVLPGMQASADRSSFRGTQAAGVETNLLGATGTGSVAQSPAIVADASIRAQEGTAQNPATAMDASMRSHEGTSQSPAVMVAQSTRSQEGTAQNPAVTADASMRSYEGTAQNPAAMVTQKAESEFRGPTQAPAVDTDLLGASGTLAVVATNPAIQQAARISDWKMTETPAADIVQVTYSLTRRVGGNAQAAVGTAWTDPGNAINGTDGIHNGSPYATVTGGALGSTNGIELNYLNHALKDELTITSATLHVYASVTGDATGLLSDTVLSYNIGAGVTQLEAIAGNFDNLINPRSYSLPLLDTWAEYDALAARVIQTMAATSIGVTANLDAIEIEIVATRTDSL